MLKYALVALAPVLAQTMAAQGVSDVAPPSSTQPPTDIIELGIEANERMTVPVSIGEAGPFHFIVDTGSQATTVTSALGIQLALRENGSATVVGVISRQRVPLVEVDDLRLGSIVLDNVLAPVLERRNLGADGIIGLDSLQDLRVQIDFTTNVIEVTDPTANKRNSGYEIVVRARRRANQLIITNAHVDGIRTTVVIDTGAQGTIGNEALHKRMRGREDGQATTTDVHGASLTSGMTFARTLEMKGFTLRNLPIAFADTPSFAALGLADRPAISLGMRDLRLFDRVAIDFATREILFDLPGKRYRTGSRLPKL